MEKDPYEVVKCPLSTEKSMRLMEAENKLLFVVDLKATKPEIKQAIEKIFNVKVTKVRTVITPDTQKRAYVTFSPDTLVLDVATQMGLM